MYNLIQDKICGNSMGVIFYGSNNKLNLERAYEYAIQYMGNNNTTHIKANTHPDFMFIQKSSDKVLISIDDARDINEFAFKKPVVALKKAIVIHNIEDLSISASNSLLKTLEEPPENVEFILTTRKLSSILPTVRSRCSKIKVTSPHKDYRNVREFVINNVNNIPEEICNRFIDYLENDKTLNASFVAENAENAFVFIEIAMQFLSYNQSTANARRILTLQELETMAHNTYPDEQNLLLSAMYIATRDM